MEFNKRYNRTEFVDFLQHKFVPEDFVVETTSIDIERQTKYIRAITKLGSSEMLDLVVYEVRHHSTQDARVGLSKEAFRFLADEWESRALVLFVPENNDANYRFSLIIVAEVVTGCQEFLYIAGQERSRISGMLRCFMFCFRFFRFQLFSNSQ